MGWSAVAPRPLAPACPPGREAGLSAQAPGVPSLSGLAHAAPSATLLFLGQQLPGLPVATRDTVHHHCPREQI